MAKFFGKIGFAGGQVEVRPGVYQDVVLERQVYGDILENSRRLVQDEGLNKNLSLGNRVSVVADAYGLAHIFAIRYVRWAGALWSVEEVTVEGPRLLLRLGGVYNGPTPAPS